MSYHSFEAMTGVKIVSLLNDAVRDYITSAPSYIGFNCIVQIHRFRDLSRGCREKNIGVKSQSCACLSDASSFLTPDMASKTNATDGIG